jgi:hypothetical protein
MDQAIIFKGEERTKRRGGTNNKLDHPPTLTHVASQRREHDEAFNNMVEGHFFDARRRCTCLLVSNRTTNVNMPCSTRKRTWRCFQRHGKRAVFGRRRRCTRLLVPYTHLLFFFSHIPNCPKVDKVIMKKLLIKDKNLFDSSFKIIALDDILVILLFFFIAYYFYIWSNTKLHLSWHYNNKKIIMKIQKCPLTPILIFFAFNGILVISLCNWDRQILICPWSIW